MAKPEYITETTKGEFLGIKPPEHEFFKIDLTQSHNITRERKTKEVISSHYGFEIFIDAKNIGNENKTLSNRLKEAFEMPFASYNYMNKTYRYYTSKYNEASDENHKKQQLQNIFNTLSVFEKEFKEQSALSLQQFKIDASQKISYVDHEVIVKFHDQLQSFVVLPINFLGGDKYSILRNASKMQGEVGLTEGVDTAYFSDLLPPRKKIQGKKFFIINPASYANIKELIEKKIEQKNDFIITQEKFSEAFKDRNFDITEDNVFDLKIVYDEKIKCFEFYCKGYTTSINPHTGNQEDRNTIARMALNTVLCEDAKPEDYHEFELMEGKKKIALTFHEESSRRDKRLLVSAEQWQQIEKIYNNYQDVKGFWSRPEKSHKVYDRDLTNLTNNIKKYPSVYFDNKGKCYLIHSFRSTSRGKPCVHMKGIELSFAEANQWMNDHPFSPEIKENSLYLNSTIWMPPANPGEYIEIEQRKEVFETILLHAKLTAESGSKVVAKKKSLKI